MVSPCQTIHFCNFPFPKFKERVLVLGAWFENSSQNGWTYKKHPDILPLIKKQKKKLYLIILFDILYVCERECDLFIRLIKPIYVLYRYFLADVQIKTVISIVSSRKKLYAFDVGRPSVQI
jgi:hypothetical protein